MTWHNHTNFRNFNDLRVVYACRGAANFAYPLNYLHPTPLPEKQQALERCKRNSLALLKQGVRSLNEQLEELGAAPSAPEVQPRELSKRVFIVHGHDNEAKEAVARFISSLDLDPIILHEQPNMGRTVIEKFEAEGKVGFAIALLTPDDLGKAKGAGELSPRARQNVVMELGYFVGRLGRKNVCALVRDTVEFPSDFAGIVYEKLDSGGAWKQALGRELDAAGYKIDWNVVMRR
jgi:predicted nucleotide-binding protein